MALGAEIPKSRAGSRHSGIGGRELSLVQVFEVAQLFLHRGGLGCWAPPGRAREASSGRCSHHWLREWKRASVTPSPGLAKRVRGSDWLSLSLSLDPREYASRGVVPVKRRLGRGGRPQPQADQS